MREISGQRWYRPREIAKQGLIKNSSGNDNASSNYVFIITLIKDGKLRAKNYGRNPKHPYWLVPDSEIRRYHDVVSKIV